MSIIQTVCYLLINIKMKVNKEKPKLIYILEWIIPILTICVYTIMIRANFGDKTFVGQGVGLTLGILFLILGNYTPKMSYENSVNLFHPRPKDEKTFRRYTRIMGYSFILLGMIAIIASIITFFIV